MAEEISPEAQRRVGAVYEALRAANVSGMVDVTPAYTTVQATFEPGALTAPSAAEVQERVREVVAGAWSRRAVPSAAGHVAEIPVCYEGADLAPDLADLAAARGLSEREVIDLHSRAEYTVAFVGFSPGFGYLTGLPKALETPRLDVPRTRVPAGSVGIAGAQTGVYPHSTPGGWRLIGRTPITLFDPQRLPPSLLVIGERVRFKPISRERFEELASRRSGA